MKLIVYAALLTAALSGQAGAGNARVVDGDTLEAGDVRIRLHGIDAPEAGQTCRRATGASWPCGKAAIAALERLVDGADVTCETQGEDSYGRVIARCRAGGADLGEALVAEGLAWSFRRYAHDYDAVEDTARAQRRGVFAGDNETPWDYRARLWLKAVGEAPAGCPIKGNINRDGERIYHPPWSPWYARTAVNEKAGERWFCDEAAAVLAGWRAPYWGR